VQSALTKRVEQLVECGWYPETTTETTGLSRRQASLQLVAVPAGRRLLPAVRWHRLSDLLVPDFARHALHPPGRRSSRRAGDVWLVRLQEARRDAYIAEHRAVKENGFLAVMWPKLLMFLVLFVAWIFILKKVL